MGSIVVVNVLVSSKKPLVPLAISALDVPILRLVLHVSLHLAGGAGAGGAIKGTGTLGKVGIALSSVLGRGSAFIFGTREGGERTGFGAGVTKVVVHIRVDGGIITGDCVVLVGTRTTKGNTVSEEVRGILDHLLLEREITT